MRFWVRSLALLTGSGVQHCHELWCRSQMRLGSGFAAAVVQAGSCCTNWTSSLGTSMCHRCNQKKKKKKKKKKRKKKIENQNLKRYRHPNAHCVALFTTAKTWNQLKHPSTEEWIKKMCYICTIEYYSAIKIIKNAIFSNMNVPRDYHTDEFKSGREIQI